MIPKLIAPLAAAAVMIGAAAGRPPVPGPSVRQAPASAPADGWLKGYARTIEGETIGYHSPYPDATSALITRATDGTMAIEWETEPVPEGFAGTEAVFVWMCGLATGKGAHRFALSIDGRPAFEFRTGRDAADKAWDAAGPDGASLSFRTVMVDQFQELFGFMTLKLPRPALRLGRPLRLRVVGEKGGSRDWHMVFQYELKPWVRASAESVLVRKGGRPFQIIRVAISHIAPPARAEISTDGGTPVSAPLETGYNAVYVPVPAVDAPRRAALDVAVAGSPARRLDVPLRPVTRRVFYLLPHSHNDIGYSGLQAKVERDHWSYLEQAREIARRTADYPEGARFKWNVETLWAVDTYLRQASPEKREALIDAVRRGWLGLEALYANVLTGVCHPEELFEVTAFARKLRRDYGLDIPSAMITDIPGYSWSVVPALAQAGVKYFSSGPNYMPSLNDGGDRIGGALKAWGDKPFYWESPSGQERILFWMAGRGYSWFHGMNMGSLGLEKRQPIFDYCRALEEQGYPYEIVQVRYTIGGDNGPPDAGLPDVVKQWNEEIESPRLRIATTREMFEALEKRYGRQLPVVRGDFTPYWEDGAASTAAETALNRAAAARLLQAETLWAMLAPEKFPAAEFDEAWRQVLLWDEHTWGAADSVSDPDGENARSQWEYKRAFALESDRRSRGLRESALKTLGSAASAAGDFVVLNTASWPRTGIVVVPPGPAAAGDRVTDDAGRAVPSQRLTSGELAARIEDVPPFGRRRFRVAAGEPGRGGRAAADGTSLSNGRISVALDPATGAVASFRWSGAPGVEFVDPSAGFGLNAYLYVPGLNPRAAFGAHGVKIRAGETGPLVASLIVEAGAPGASALRSEYRIFADSDRLEIIDGLDKKKVRTPESVHFAFPLRLPGGAPVVDIGWARVRPGPDQIAGSCRDFFCPQNGADAEAAGYGVAWISPDAPLLEIGAMTDETRSAKGTRIWKETLAPSTHFYSYLMNNYWHTNYKADQEGPVTVRFVLEPHRGVSGAEAKRIGLDVERPLIAAPGGSAPSRPAALRVASGAAVVTSLRPARDGGFAARIYNPTAHAVEARLEVPGAEIVMSDPDEKPGAALRGPLRLGPYQTAAVLIRPGRSGT